jgi:hypothetical protein
MHLHEQTAKALSCDFSQWYGLLMDGLGLPVTVIVAAPYRQRICRPQDAHADVLAAVQTLMILTQSVIRPKLFGSAIPVMRHNVRTVLPINGTGEAVAGFSYASANIVYCRPGNASTS